jgi:hypothetical protein
MRRTSIAKAIAAVLLAGAALAVAGCGPKEGTPDWVLARLRQGILVGAPNLALLTDKDLPGMKALVEDAAVLREGRMQALQRMMGIETKAAAEILPTFLAHKDPEVRLRVAEWMTYRGQPSMVKLLVDRLKTEKEEIVRLAIISALQRIGGKIEKPDPAIVSGMLALLADPATPNRDEWAMVLGGWGGDDVIPALTKALSDKDLRVEIAAARAIVGPRLRPLDVVTSIQIGMLEHKLADVRRAALSGLVSDTRPGRVQSASVLASASKPDQSASALASATKPGQLQTSAVLASASQQASARLGASCAERPTLALLEEVPDLVSIMNAHLARKNVEGQERRLAEEVKRCVEKFTGEDDAGPAGDTGGK